MNRVLSTQQVALLVRAGPRPKPQDWLELQGVEVVVTLMMETENLQQIQLESQKIRAEWLLCPIRAVNWELLNNEKIFLNLLTGLNVVKNAVRAGKKVFIHCAAGIHRTGFFLYVLIRLLGLSVADTLKTIQEVRPVVLEKAGKHRLELGEKFYLFSVSRPVLIPYYRIPDIRQGDFLNPDLPVFAFFKVLFEESQEFENCSIPGNPENIVKIQFSCTTFDFYKFVIGGELLTKTGLKFFWEIKRKASRSGRAEWKTRDEGKVLGIREREERLGIQSEIRSLEEVDQILDEFLSSSTENPCIYLVGFQAFFDLEFLSKCCPRVHRRFNSRIIDLRTFRIFGMTDKCYSIYDDLNMCLKVRSMILSHE